MPLADGKWRERGDEDGENEEMTIRQFLRDTSAESLQFRLEHKGAGRYSLESPAIVMFVLTPSWNGF